MNQRDIAIRFVERFCDADVDGVEALLSPSFTFNGPFFRFGNRRDYIESLRRDPPQPCRYELLSITGNENEVALFYDYIKAEMPPLTIAQLFRFDAQQRIERIVLVFDGREK